MSKIILVYSNIISEERTGYAINLASALFMAVKFRILLVDSFEQSLIDRQIHPGAGVDILKLSKIEEDFFKRSNYKYQYIVVNIGRVREELLYHLFSRSDSIHFFVDSTKDSLNKANYFLKELSDKGLEGFEQKLKIIVNRLNVFDRLSVQEITWLIKANVWALVPEVDFPEVLVDTQGRPLVLRSRGHPYSRAVLRIAKREAGKLVGLALGSGAAFGLAHIGILKILERNNIEVDILSGSSMGALIASLWGVGFDSNRIEKIARQLRNRLAIMRLLDFTIPISGILAGRRLKAFLRDILGEKSFEDLKIPVKIVVYDLANRETLCIDRGRVVDAVYMSIAVPGIFKPIIQRDRTIVDGGILDPVPVDVLMEQGVSKIIAVNVLPGPEDILERNILLKKKLEEEERLLIDSPFYKRTAIAIKRWVRRFFTPNIFDVIMSSMQSMEYSLAEDSCKSARVVLHPVLFDATSIDFHRVRDFIKRGEQVAEEHIEEIKRLVFE